MKILKHSFEANLSLFAITTLAFRVITLTVTYTSAHLCCIVELQLKVNGWAMREPLCQVQMSNGKFSVNKNGPHIQPNVIRMRLRQDCHEQANTVRILTNLMSLCRSWKQVANSLRTRFCNRLALRYIINCLR